MVIKFNIFVQLNSRDVDHKVYSLQRSEMFVYCINFEERVIKILRIFLFLLSALSFCVFLFQSWINVYKVNDNSFCSLQWLWWRLCNQHVYNSFFSLKKSHLEFPFFSGHVRMYYSFIFMFLREKKLAHLHACAPVWLNVYRKWKIPHSHVVLRFI